MNFKEIIRAWIIASKPTKKQLQLALLRGKICDGCESKKTILGKVPYCGECGCPIGKKIFTDSYNPCDLKKWSEVDEAFFPPQKKKKTFI